MVGAALGVYSTDPLPWGGEHAPVRVVVSKSVLRKAVLGLWPGPLRAVLIAGTMVVTSFGSAASPAGSGQPPVLGEVFRDCGMPEDGGRAARLIRHGLAGDRARARS